MRELKFRSWDVQFKRMKTSGFGVYEGKLLGDDIVLMQATGLKDRNGADIYEGDSLSLNGELWGDVVFEDGAFKIDVGSQTQEKTQINQARCARFEVAGNIYENPAKKTNKNT